MICPRCGAHVGEDDSECPGCGLPTAFMDPDSDEDDEYTPGARLHESYRLMGGGEIKFQGARKRAGS